MAAYRERNRDLHEQWKHVSSTYAYSIPSVKNMNDDEDDDNDDDDDERARKTEAIEMPSSKT